MNSCADFCEDIKVGYGKMPLGDGIRAYRMDGSSNPNMRDHAGLGNALSCCDYLWVDHEKILLIEETELWEKVKSLRDEYNDLRNDEDIRDKYVKERIKWENCLKVYGSMLMLCRLGKWPQNKPLTFILLASGDIGSARALRYWDPEDELAQSLKSALLGDCDKQSPIEGQLAGGKLVSNVRVLTADELREFLSGSVSTCS